MESFKCFWEDIMDAKTQKYITYGVEEVIKS